MKNKDTEKKERMTAVQFIRNYEDTLNVIENISNETVDQQDAIIESANKNDYTTEEGVFKMESLMDVDIPSNLEQNQPRYYNTPMEELTDGEKALVVDAGSSFYPNIHKMIKVLESEQLGLDFPSSLFSHLIGI